MMGFLLIFCLQVLLFLFVSLVMEGGLSSQQSLNFFHLLGTILSIPIFVYGLASTLTMASEFVVDTWEGHAFFRTILRWSAVFIDWYSFVAFLGIPLCVMVYEMFKSEHFWERTALTWFACVTVTFALFCLGIFVFEIWGALELLSHHPDYALIDLSIRRIGKFLKRAIHLRQLHRYCGVRNRTFFIEGGQALPTANDSYDASDAVDHEFSSETISWYAKFTQRLPDEWFYEYEKPKRQFNIEDVLDREVFITGTYKKCRCRYHCVNLWLRNVPNTLSMFCFGIRCYLELGKAFLSSQKGTKCRGCQRTVGHYQRSSYFQFLVCRLGYHYLRSLFCCLGSLGRSFDSRCHLLDGRLCRCQSRHDQAYLRPL